MSKAWYGALMGLGQGISGYGDALTKNALAVQADERASARQRERDERESIRQQSLQEIRQQFETDMQDRREAFDLQKIEDARQYDLDKVNPETEAGRLLEAERQRELERQIELRETPYGGRTSSVPTAIQNTEYYKGLSPEERVIYDRVNKISELGVLDQKDMDKAVLDLYKTFTSKSQYDQEDELLRHGIDPETPPDQAEMLLIEAYREKINVISGQGQQPETQAQPVPLMDDGYNAPGSSRANPIDAASLPNKPPPGTWVRLPNGEIKQVQ